MNGHSYLPPIFEAPHGYGRTRTPCYLYVAEILEVGVKVGVTSDPAARLNQHVAGAWAYRRHIGRAWVGRRVFRVDDAEADLVRALGSGPSRSEYLDASFDDVARLAADRLGVPGVFPIKLERVWLRNAARVVDKRDCSLCGAAQLARVERKTVLVHECLACAWSAEIPDQYQSVCGSGSGSSGSRKRR